MSDFKLPSGKEVLVLELLVGKREMYGLEMVNAGVGLGRGTIYVLLGRMEDKGFVTSRRANESNPLRVYSITGLGQRAYAAWRSVEQTMAGAAPAGASL